MKVTLTRSTSTFCHRISAFDHIPRSTQRSQRIKTTIHSKSSRSVIKLVFRMAERRMTVRRAPLGQTIKKRTLVQEPARPFYGSPVSRPIP